MRSFSPCQHALLAFLVLLSAAASIPARADCFPGCNDDNPCTVDTCQGTTCVHSPGNPGTHCQTFCNNPGTCNGSGICVSPAPACDDQNPCTRDVCSSCSPGPGGSQCCYHYQDVCDDGNVCTADACDAGNCSHAPVPCDDLDLCTRDFCDPAYGGCVFLADVCDDANACTLDACDGGTCSHTIRACDDGNACTDDSCDPSAGCVFAPSDAHACADSNPCTESDSCFGGACVCSHATVPCVPGRSDFYRSVDQPIQLRPSRTTSTIQVASLDRFIDRVRLQTFLNVSNFDRVQATLRSPQGTVVTLSSNNGGVTQSATLDGTWWRDDADPENAIPFPGQRFSASNIAPDMILGSSFRDMLVPEEPLSAFRGEDPNGTWVLSASVDASSGNDLLRGWLLQVFTLPSPIVLGPTVFTSSASVAIPDYNGGSWATPIQVTGLPGKLARARLTTRIRHPRPSDLEITLRSAAATTITISNRRGGSRADAFDGTMWDDDADPGNDLPLPTGPFATSNLVSDAVFSGAGVRSPLVPEEPLGAFLDQDPNGTWFLSVRDTVAGVTGVLDGWSVALETQACPAPCALCDDLDACTTDACGAGGCDHVRQVPGPVGSLSLASDRSTLSWTPPSGALTDTSYDVVRGAADHLPVGSAGETCLVAGTAATSIVDGSVPPSGRAYWYLVRAVGGCGAGTYGHAGVHGAPAGERVTDACSIAAR